MDDGPGIRVRRLPRVAGRRLYVHGMIDVAYHVFDDDED